MTVTRLRRLQLAAEEAPVMIDGESLHLAIEEVVVVPRAIRVLL